MPNNVTAKFGAKDNLSSELDKIRGKFDKLQKQGAKGFAIGAGAAITAKGINLLTSTVDGFVDVMGDAVTAAIEDEASQQKLRSSLMANIEAWDGNTDAIERTLKVRTKLGFSDDEQRDSLARLVAATHDVNKALNIQRTAMDLARFKGIGLAEATDALTKVEAGSYRILKSLGIQLKDNATQTEALAAVQKVANGQAEDYAKTTGGKLLVAQTEFNEALEQAGYVLLPVVSAGLETLTRALDQSTISYDDAAQAAKKGSQAAEAHARAMEASGHGAEDFADKLDRAERSLRDVGSASDNTRPKVYKTWQDLQRLGESPASKAYQKWLAARASQLGAYGGLLSSVVGLQQKLGKAPTTGRGSANAKGGKASGGPAFGRTLVGEQGPEWLDLPSGSFVHDAKKTQQMGPGGGGDIFNITFTGPVGGDQNNLMRQVERARRVARGKKVA